jgi:hypothetical protein
MNDDTANQSQPGNSGNDTGERTLSGREILVIFAVIALVCVGGYFFLLKMIDVSQQDDCILAHRRNCAPGEPLGR